MANQEQLDILKQGVQVWNQWRREHLDIRPNLSYADLSTADLIGANLSDSDLRRVNLRRAKLITANLVNASLSDAKLSYADLRRADLSGADLSNADLIGANFSDANLSYADLIGANLSGADLRRANLIGADLGNANLSTADLSTATLNNANLSDANLSNANLKEAIVGYTSFGDVDLSVVKNLETVKHLGPSTIGIDTIYRSQGKIPEAFLNGAGVPDSFLEYMRSLVGKPIDYYSCFISYSSKDQAFAERLYADLQSKDVRCWYAPEDMDIGDKIRPRIEESIRLYDKLLLVLSEHSIASNWVAYEVERALNKEPQGKPNVLYPIRVDDAVMETKADWVDDIKSTRHIGDFTHWKSHDDYQKAFNRLLRALKAK